MDVQVLHVQLSNIRMLLGVGYQFLVCILFIMFGYALSTVMNNLRGSQVREQSGDPDDPFDEARWWR